jgi:hypothetical protein
MDDQLALIHEGMVVYDNHSKRVGVVEFVQYTDEDLSQPWAQTRQTNDSDKCRRRSLVNDMLDVLDFEDDRLTDTLRNRLSREGYIRVDGGFLAPDRAVLLDQIAAVVDESVLLNVHIDDVIVL